MKRILLMLFLAMFVNTAVFAQDDIRKMVLVTSTASKLGTLDNKELKRLYLGLNVKKAGLTVVPIRNYSDSLLHEVFLQHVMFMSSRNYEKQLVSMAMRSGKKRIDSKSSFDDLIKDLVDNENSVSYLWEEDARKYSNLKIIQDLWKGSVN